MNRILISFPFQKNMVPDSKFYVWDISGDSFLSMSFPGHFISKICWEAEDSMYIALELTVVPPDLRVSSEEERANQESTPESGDSNELKLSNNPYLVKRAEKANKLNARTKYLKNFESVEPPALKELQQLMAELENPRRKGRVQGTVGGSSVPPWEIHARQLSGGQSRQALHNGANFDLENEASTMKHQGKHAGAGDTDVDEGFVESPVSSVRKSKNTYKKPMLQSKPRFRKAAASAEATTDPSPTPEKIVTENTENVEAQAPATKKTGVVNLTSKKQFLDLAGFTRRTEDDTLETVAQEIPANQILTLFVCSSAGILKHEKILKTGPSETFLGLDVPYWYFLSKRRNEDSKKEVN